MTKDLPISANHLYSPMPSTSWSITPVVLVTACAETMFLSVAIAAASLLERRAELWFEFVLTRLVWSRQP